ncbi:MAG: hypothetical protein R6X33_08990, partial [Candidatus Brocadiia bacterium]
TVAVRIEGVRPEGVAVVWDGQTFEDRRILMTGGDDGTWKGRFPAVLEDGAYHVVAGDTRSERYQVRALPEPVVEQIELRVQPPEYTGRPARTVEAGDLEVVQATRVGLTARTSLEAKGGYVSFGSGRRVPLDPLPDEAGLGGEFTAMRSDTWAVHFESITYPGGATFKNATPLEYRLTVGEDQAPTVRVEQPPDGVTVERDAVVRVVYTAQDDFGLRAVRLHHGVGGFYGKPAVIARPAGAEVEGAVWEWDLSELTVSPGQTITYYLEAEDNRPDVPQTGRSKERRIVIAGEPGEPAEPPLGRQEEGATPGEPPEGTPADQSEREPAGERPSADRAGRGREERPEGSDEEGAETAEQDRFASLRDYVRRLREEMGEPTDGGTGGAEAAGERAGRPSAAQREAETAPPGAPSESAPQPRDAVAEPGERTADGEPAGEAERSSDGPSAPGEGPEQAGDRPEAGEAGRRSATEAGGPEGRSATGDGQGSATEPALPEGQGAEGGASGERGAGGAGAAPDGRTGAGAGASGRSEGGAAEGDAGEAAGEAGGRSGAASGGQLGAPGSAAGGAAGQGSDGAGQTGQAGPGGTRDGRPGGAGAGAGGQGVQQLPPPGPRETALGDEGMSAAVEELERMLEQNELPNALLDELGMEREDLRELIGRFRERAAEGRDSAESDRARALREPEGRVLPGAAAAADEMALRDALPAGEPDRLRSRFEGADEQLSTRYQEVVNQYYKALSEEP